MACQPLEHTDTLFPPHFGHQYFTVVPHKTLSLPPSLTPCSGSPPETPPSSCPLPLLGFQSVALLLPATPTPFPSHTQLLHTRPLPVQTAFSICVGPQWPLPPRQCTSLCRLGHSTRLHCLLPPSPRLRYLQAWTLISHARFLYCGHLPPHTWARTLAGQPNPMKPLVLLPLWLLPLCQAQLLLHRSHYLHGHPLQPAWIPVVLLHLHWEVDLAPVLSNGFW